MKRILFAGLIIVSMSSFAKGFLGDLGIAGEIVDLGTSDYIQLVSGSLTPANKIQTGLKSVPIINVDGGVNYELIGVYGGVSVNGLNAAPHRDAVGVQGTVFKNSADNNAVGVKCSVYDLIPGGTSTCLEVSFPYAQAGAAGITFRVPSWASGLIGINFAENAHAYKYAANFAGAPVAMGSRNGSHYCIQFNEISTNLEYIKNCGTNTEQVVGRITITPIITKGKKK